MHSSKTLQQLSLLFLITILLVGERLARGQGIGSTPEIVAPDSTGVGFTTTELRSGNIGDNIGLRTENPGPFLNWPLPASVPYTNISVIPDSPWTENFLGISDCPKYPPMIDNYTWVWYYPGQFTTYALPGTTKDRVRFKNVDDTGLFYNFFACYRATSGSEWHEGSNLPDHAGTDISAANATAVLAASYADEIYVVVDSAGDYRIRLRHPNANGSGQTWYTFYVHLSSSAFPLGITIPPGGMAPGTTIGGVGNYHLHFQAGLTENYSNSGGMRNIWGIDQAPWTGCLWKDSTLCPIKPNNCCGCSMAAVGHNSGSTTFADMMKPQGPPLESTSHSTSARELQEGLLNKQYGSELPDFGMPVLPFVTVEAEVGAVTSRESYFADAAGAVYLASSSSSSSDTLDSIGGIILDPPSSDNYKLTRSVLGMGGGVKTSSSYILLGTSGQPFATGPLASSSYRLNSGYWGMSASTSPPTITPTATASNTPTPTVTGTVVWTPTPTATTTPTLTPIPGFMHKLNLPVIIAK